MGAEDSRFTSVKFKAVGDATVTSYAMEANRLGEQSSGSDGEMSPRQARFQILASGLTQTRQN